LRARGCEFTIGTNMMKHLGGNTVGGKKTILRKRGGLTAPTQNPQRVIVKEGGEERGGGSVHLRRKKDQNRERTGDTEAMWKKKSVTPRRKNRGQLELRLKRRKRLTLPEKRGGGNGFKWKVISGTRAREEKEINFKKQDRE